MISGGAKKAALLLMSLDSSSAAELLRNAPKNIVTQIATEIAHLEAAGAMGKTDRAEPTKEFFTLLSGRGGGGSKLPSLLEKAMGPDQAGEIIHAANLAVQERDPFLTIRSAEIGDLARILRGESGQVAALVLAELSANKASKLLGMLDERIRGEAVRGMTSGEGASEPIRRRVATRLTERLTKQFGGGGAGSAEQTAKYRKVAMLLRGLESTARDALLKAIDASDAEAGKAVRDLMIVWEDVPNVDDISLQNILRLVDASTLALALHEAEPEVAAKIDSNISERARALVEEEASLMASPKREDVSKARDEILAAMRDLAATGQLEFEEEQ